MTKLWRKVIAELGLTGRDGRLSHTKTAWWVLYATVTAQHGLSLGTTALFLFASYGLKGLTIIAPYFNLSSNQEQNIGP